MTIFVDEPRWPAHGTRYAHLVSDASTSELEAFVARLELPRRLRFHRDHYDIPERFWRQIVDAGAQTVSTREIVLRLRSSGLRAPAR